MIFEWSKDSSMNCFGSSSTNISGFKYFKLLYFSLVPVNKRNKLCLKIQYKLFYWWSLGIMTFKFVVPVSNPHHFPNQCHWLYLSSHCTVSFYVILIEIALNFPTQHLTNFTCCEFTANTAIILHLTQWSYTWHTGLTRYTLVLHYLGWWSKNLERVDIQLH